MSPSNPTTLSSAEFSDMDIQQLRKTVEEIEKSSVQTELPRYKCHKQVWALKIADVKDTTNPGDETDGSRILIFEDSKYAPIRVNHEYVRKHSPASGGYYVVYEDGYKSFSPAKAFEDGYSKIGYP